MSLQNFVSAPLLALIIVFKGLVNAIKTNTVQKTNLSVLVIVLEGAFLARFLWSLDCLHHAVV